MLKRIVIQTRVTQEIKEKFSKLTEKKGMTESAYLRYLINIDIRRQEGEKSGK